MMDNLKIDLNIKFPNNIT